MIQPHQNHPSEKFSPNHKNHFNENNPNGITKGIKKRKVSKDRQQFINNMAASEFKVFSAL